MKLTLFAASATWLLLLDVGLAQSVYGPPCIPGASGINGNLGGCEFDIQNLGLQTQYHSVHTSAVRF